MSDDDVFNTPSVPPVVDFAILEAAKENIQPLASGRRATALASLLSTPHAQREAALSATRARLRTNVEIALADYDPDDTEEEGDPVDAYARLVNWTLESYPEGQSAASNLLPLLEEATRVLKDHANGRWRADARYLKLWALYAGYVERPEIVWRFLLANEIGTGWAAMYEGFASVLEGVGKTKEADEMYSLGIARNAEPVARLEAKYREFQKRMMAGVLAGPSSVPSASSSSPVAASSAPALAAAPRRKVLGETTKKSSTSAAPPPVAPAPSRPNGRLQVFVDGADEEPPAPSGSSTRTAGPPTNAWNDLGTRVSRVKENTTEVTKMAGSTLKQPGATARRAASGPTTRAGFAVFVDSVGDDPVAAMPPPSAPPEKKRGTGATTIKKEGQKGPVSSRKPAKSTSGSSRSGSNAARAGFAIFVDGAADDVETMPPPPVAPVKKQRTGTAIAKKQEEEEEEEAEPVSPQTPAKPKFMPFVDEAPAIGAAFTPFRDETTSPSKGFQAPGSVMKPKLGAAASGSSFRGTGQDVTELATASEAEALRKDPLKNYNLC